jgi:transposase
MGQRKQSTFERLEKLNRKQRRQLGSRVAAGDPSLQIVHPDAAGIDVGNASHFVAVPGGRDEQPVREFGCWTADLHKMAEWLVECGIRTVAMQSTGVYWVALMEVLEEAGLEVYLVNARGTKNIPGRKSDVQECQWLMKLHSYGLLRNSFRPPEQIRVVRSIWRQRERVVMECGRMVQRMQKALTSMNVQLANVISDISGVTGMRIIRRILDGERDGRVLANLREPTIRASEAEIVASLEGHWRPEYLFELKQVVEAYDFYREQMRACDEELEKALAALPDHPVTGEPVKARRKSPSRRKNQPGFDLGEQLQRVLGVDLTTIDGVEVTTAQVILAEIGWDFSAFPDEDHSAGWLGLAPRNDVSGGRVIRHVRPDVRNRLANALRMATQALWRSESYLGARYRSLRGRMEGEKANKAMARYLACLIYRLVTKGQAYVDRGAEYFENKRQQRQLMALERRAAQLNMRLVPAT